MFSSPPPTWMFRFGGFASPYRVMPCLRMAGCPIRTPADLRPFAPPRRLSRPAASFLASGSQGILRAPSLASRSSVSTRSLVSVFLPSCQRTAQGESLLCVENVGLEPTTPGLQSRCSSQLSQSPRRVVPGRLELPTPTLSVWCSNQLSYGTPAPAEDPETRPAAPAACAPSVFSLSVCSGQHRTRTRLSGVPLQKGGVPAAPSGTATLLRLSPSHPVRPRRVIPGFRRPRLPWLDGRCVQGPGTYSPRHG